MQSAIPDIELSPSPNDGITALKVIDNRFLLVSSWDSGVYLYDLANNTLKTSYNHKAAVLDCTFSDKYHAHSGGIDKTIKSYDITTSTESVLGTHEKPVKAVDYSTTHGLIVSGGWDNAMKIWDPRIPAPCVGSYTQPDKIFTLSVSQDKLVVGGAGRYVHIYDLRTMEEPLQKRESPLKFQTRCIRCFPDAQGYALSSIEGRVAMEYFDPAPQIQAKKYAFKCHRVTQSGVDTVYPVNAISFNQKWGTFATGGCDGVVNIWDGENKKRLAQFSRYPTSISALAFSEDSSLLVIASSYTFEEGEKDHPPDQIFVRTIHENEVRPKTKQVDQ